MIIEVLPRFEKDLKQLAKKYKNNPLLNVKNIILTPHIAWASVEAREKLVKLAYENIKSLIKEI